MIYWLRKDEIQPDQQEQRVASFTPETVQTLGSGSLSQVQSAYQLKFSGDRHTAKLGQVLKTGTILQCGVWHVGWCFQRFPFAKELTVCRTTSERQLQLEDVACP